MNRPIWLEAVHSIPALLGTIALVGSVFFALVAIAGGMQ